MSQANVHVIIPAGGVGTRVGTKVPKQLLPFGQTTMLEHTVSLFADVADTLTVVVPKAYREQMAELLGEGVKVVIGGASRYQSVRNGFQALLPLKDQDIVLIHDAARPFLDPKTLPEALALVAKKDAVIYGCVATDTIKKVGDQLQITKTLDRDRIYRAQTPQLFKVSFLNKAYRFFDQHERPEPTDEAGLLEMAGLSVYVFPSSPANAKITQREDLAKMPQVTLRIGHGYDVHRFDVNRPLYLGGVAIPDGPGLLGHSDADVCIHALIDACLGAAGKGDIGSWFPDNDPTYEGIRSTHLLEEVITALAGEGYFPVNADVTIVAQVPKLAPYIPAMRSSLAEHLHLSLSQVNLKATTTEGLGFVGQKEGMAAHAVVLLEKGV